MNHIDLLKDDYSQTLCFIDKCDNHIFKIKNWALITSSAVIAFSFTQNNYFIALGNLALLIAFIYLELIYKSFQDTAINHTADISQRIDKYLENSETDELLANYKHGFGRKLQYPSIKRVFSILRNSNRRHILNFYLLLALFSICSTALAKYVF